MANRKRDTQRLQAYIPKKIYEKLREAAEKEDMSMSEYTKVLLEAALS